MKKKQRGRKVINWLTIVFFAILLFSGCTQDNPVQTGQDSDSVEKTKISGNIIQTEVAARAYLTQGRVVDSASSDRSDGFFEFSGVQQGNYQLKIVSDNYDTVVINVEIKEGNAVYIGAIYLIEKNPFDDSIPSIYDHYPQDKSELVFNPYTYYTGQEPPRLYVSVSFDRPMDRVSVEKALTIDPPAGGYFVWSQNRQQYNVPETYGEYNWSGERLDMGFSEDMVKAPSAPAQISTFSKVQSFTYYFNMSDCFTDTTYTISISREALDTGGVPLDSALEYSFSTVQSAVAYTDIQMNPHNGEDYVDLFRSQGISITFPNRMDQTSVENNLSMLPEDTEAILLWQDYNKLSIITSGRILIPDTTYTITIDSAALDAAGDPLGKTSVLSFSTRSISVKSSSPGHADMMVDPWVDITVSFNTYMDKTSFNGKLFLVSGDNDTVSGTIDYYNYSTSRGIVWVKEKIMFNPAADLLYDTKYTLSILPGVTDRLGYPMQSSHELIFVTRP